MADNEEWVDTEVAEANTATTEDDYNNEAHTDDTTADPQGPAVDTADDTSTEAGVSDEEKAGEQIEDDSEGDEEAQDFSDINVYANNTDLHAYVNSDEFYDAPTNVVSSMRNIERTEDKARRLAKEREEKDAE